MKNNKQNKPTFADRARALQNKYKKAAWDKLEADELEAEMEKLQAEQEQMRQMMGLNEQPQQQVFGDGGSPEDPEIQDINNPTQYPNGTIYQDDRGWLEKRLDRLYGTYESNKPQLFKDFPILDTPGMMLQYVTGNTPSDGNVQGGGPLMVGGRGFKNIPVQRTILKQTFVKTGFNSSRPTVTPKYIQGAPQPKITSVPKGVVPGSVTNMSLKGATNELDDALSIANKESINNMRATQTELSRKNALQAYKNRVAQAQLNKAQQTTGKVSKNYGDLEGTVDPLTPGFFQTLPWKNIGYGAAGIGGAGVLGAGIYGLTQLPDGTVVDKQGNPVPQSQVDAVSGANMPISKQAGFQPTKEYLDAIGWNSKLPTVQQVKSGVKGKNNIIKQDLVQGTLLSPEQASVGIETDIRNSNTFSPESLNFHSKQLLNTGLEFDKLKTFASGQQAKADDMNKPGFWDKNKQYLPYAISGASNIASNLLLAAMAKKNQTKINPVLATPTQINMEPQAEQMRKDASVSKNIGMRQARDLGLNAGATLANMGAIGSGVDRQLGANLTNLYGQQEQYNVGAANQFALQNQDVANRANMVNAQFEQQANQDRLGYIGGALGTIPGVMKDVRMDKADKETRGIMESYYKSLGGRNYLPIGSIFESGGFKYKVKDYNPDGTPITEKVK